MPLASLAVALTTTEAPDNTAPLVGAVTATTGLVLSTVTETLVAVVEWPELSVAIAVST